MLSRITRRSILAAVPALIASRSAKAQWWPFMPFVGSAPPIGFYFEATITQTMNEAQACIGLAGGGFNLTTPWDLDVSPPMGIGGANGLFWSWHSAGAGDPWGYPLGPVGPPAVVNGNVVGIATVPSHSLAWIKNVTTNSAWYGGPGSGSTDPVGEVQGIDFSTPGGRTPIVGPIFILGGAYYNNFGLPTPAILTLNAGHTAFTGAIPAGYVAWDTTVTTTFNPFDKAAGVNLSGGNLTLTTPAGGLMMVRSTTSKMR